MVACVLPQVHNDLKTKHILLSEAYETAKIGALMALCTSCGMAIGLLAAPSIVTLEQLPLTLKCLLG